MDKLFFLGNSIQDTDSFMDEIHSIRDRIVDLVSEMYEYAKLAHLYAPLGFKHMACVITDVLLGDRVDNARIEFIKKLPPKDYRI